MRKDFKFKLSLILVLIVVLFSTNIFAVSLPNKVLPFMSKGEDVKQVQEALNYLGAHLTVDGIYGNGTKNAVLNFQSQYPNLSNDGIYGPSTKTVLDQALGNIGNDNNSDKPSNINLPNNILRLNSRGEGVREVQKALNNVGFHLTADGIYGKGTQDAVRSFQRSHGTGADGIYGPSTKQLLEKALSGNVGTTPPPVPSGKIAYLTFDDGPSANVTPKILDILDNYDIKATFFMLGNMAKSNPNLVKKVRANGHSIGNHSYSHNYEYIYANSDNFLGEVYRTDEILRGILGSSFNSKLFRFPGGSFESYKNQYKNDLKNIGFRYYDWNALNGDAEGNNIPAISLINRVKETARGQDELIVLMHDASSKATTAEALPQIIEYLKGQGYTFDKLSE